MKQYFSEDPKKAIIGTWRLVSSEFQGVGGRVIALDAVGCIMYDEHGYMSAQYIKSGAKLEGTADEIRAAFEICVSYYGTYEVNIEKGSVVHHVEASMFPNVQPDLERFCKFSDNRLSLTTTPMQVGDSEGVLAFIWERVK